MKVILEIPEHLRFQLVYRLERDRPFEAAAPPGYTFHSVGTVRSALGSLRTLVGAFGVLGAVKAVLKVLTGRRHLYLVRDSAGVVSYGWGTIGKCGYYKIEPDAVVVGPIWTDDRVRGRGLATTALQMALDVWMKSGRRLFYIDTERANFPAQKVFEKCGFGPPIALYIR